MPNTTTVPHPNCSLSACGPPRTLCTSCTSCLEQPVLYRFTSLHCMSPSSVQRVYPSDALTPLMPFLSYFPVKAADLRSQRSLSVLHLTTSPWSLLHVIHLSTIDTTRMQSLCTIFLVPMPSLLSVTLLPRLPLPIRLISTLLPHAATYTFPSPAYRIPYIVSSLDLHSKKAPALYTSRTSLHLLDPVSPYLLRPFRFVLVVANFCSLGSEHREREKMK
ncbi:hypothetical protein BGY98DRAFT_527886 [Russula aff. rugulosa BPL654]|nr:hypothetical protein BGY98DRAFT_527886 [Russula aff. rugulosa BPL654]